MKRIALFCVPLGGIAVVYVVLAGIGLVPAPGQCVDEVRATTRVGRLAFDIIETDCDTLAKEATISVYAMSPNGEKRALVLRFDPGNDDLPRITAVSPDRIAITASDVSYIHSRRDDWDGVSFSYSFDPQKKQ
jgi:hypothetical protein